MAVRRLRKHAAHLEITAFINLIVVLVPFLLSTAVFSRLSVIDLTLPAQSSAAIEKLKADDLKLEITIRPDAIEVGDKVGGLIQRIANTPKGHDLAMLNALLFTIKGKFPDKSDVSILAEQNTPYDSLVHVMDAVRSGRTANGGTTPVRVDLFPNISVGDAPMAKR
jgi:biopolymer transport protein ExbD